MIKLYQKSIVTLLVAAFIAWPALTLAEDATTAQSTDPNSEDVLQEIPLDNLTDGGQADFDQYGDVVSLSDEEMAQLEEELNTPLTYDNIDPKYYKYGYFSYQEEKIISEAVAANSNIDEWQQTEILAKLSADDYYIMDSLSEKVAYLQNNLIAMPEMNMVAGLYNFDVAGLALNKENNSQGFSQPTDFIQKVHAQDNSTFSQQLQNLYKESYCRELGGDHPGGQGVDAMKCNLTTISQNYKSFWGATQFKDSALSSQLQQTGFVINFFDQYTWWQQFFKKNPGWSHKDKVEVKDLERFYFWNSTFNKVKAQKQWTKQEAAVIGAWNKIVNDAEFEKTVYEIWVKYATEEAIFLATGEIAGHITGYLWKKVGVSAADFIIANVFKTTGIGFATDSVFAVAVKTYAKDLATQSSKVAGKMTTGIANSFRSLSDYVTTKLVPYIEERAEKILPKTATGLSTRSSQRGAVLKLKGVFSKSSLINVDVGGYKIDIDLKRIFRESKISFSKQADIMEDVAKILNAVTEDSIPAGSKVDTIMRNNIKYFSFTKNMLKNKDVDGLAIYQGDSTVVKVKSSLIRSNHTARVIHVLVHELKHANKNAIRPLEYTYMRENYPAYMWAIYDKKYNPLEEGFTEWETYQFLQKTFFSNKKLSFKYFEEPDFNYGSFVRKNFSLVNYIADNGYSNEMKLVLELRNLLIKKGLKPDQTAHAIKVMQATNRYELMDELLGIDGFSRKLMENIIRDINYGNKKYDLTNEYIRVMETKIY